MTPLATLARARAAATAHGASSGWLSLASVRATCVRYTFKCSDSSTTASPVLAYRMTAYVTVCLLGVKKTLFKTEKRFLKNSEKCQCASTRIFNQIPVWDSHRIVPLSLWLFVLLYTAVCSAQSRGYRHASLPIQLRGRDVSAYQLRLRRGIQMKKCCSAFALLQHQLT